MNIIGRLTRNPELKDAGGTALCSLRLAVDRAGAKQDDGSIGAGFFDVNLWGRSAEVAHQHLSKGRQIGVTGELRWREWEQDGAKRQGVEINGRSFTFVGDRGSDDGVRPDGGGGFGVSEPDDIPFEATI